MLESIHLESINHPQLIHADIYSLLKYRILLPQESNLFFHCEILIHYKLLNKTRLKITVDTLEKKWEEPIEDDDFLLILSLAKVQLNMLERVLNKEQIEAMLSLIKKVDWGARLYSLLGYGMYLMNDYSYSRSLYQVGYKECRKVGDHQYALFALFNVFVMSAIIDQKSIYLSTHFFFIKECLKFNYFRLACTAYFNAAYELYKFGVFISSLRLVEEGIMCLNQTASALQVHEGYQLKAEILYAMDRSQEANYFYNIVKDSEFLSISESAKVINHRYGEEKSENIKLENLTPRWSQLLLDPVYKKIKQLGPLEDKVITLLAEAPLSLDEIIKHVYPETNFEDARNRVTTLISRINAKNSGLIEYDGKLGVYLLHNNELIFIDVETKDE